MNRNRRRRVTYRPSKAQGVIGVVMGCIFVCIGLFVVIPTGGLFGIIWTGMAVAITVGNAYQAFGKGYVGPEIHIEDENGESVQAIAQENRTAEQRLQELRSLYDQRLITKEEYETKREAILKEF